MDKSEPPLTVLLAYARVGGCLTEPILDEDIEPHTVLSVAKRERPNRGCQRGSLHAYPSRSRSRSRPPALRAQGLPMKIESNLKPYREQ